MPNTKLTDATPEGVSVEEQFASLTSPESPRMKAMAAIEEKNRERFEAEVGESIPAEPDPVVEPAPEQEPEPEPKIETKKVKIDGVEEEVTEDELIRAYQKNKAADRRLEEAARLLRQAEQLAAQPAPEIVTADVAPDTNDDLRKEAAETLSMIYEGNESAAVDALVGLLGKVKGGDQPTPNSSAQQIDEEGITSKVLERMQINTAFERVKTDYPDLISDPDLEMLAAIKIDQRVAQGESRANAMLTVADDLYKALGKTPVGRQAAPETQKNSRQENKERLDTVPSASATAIVPQSQEGASPSDVIAELAAKRLGQSLPRTT